MTDYALAEAFVQIRPDTTGFRAETEAKVKAALSGIHPEIKVKISPDVKAFATAVKTALADALGKAGGGAVSVPVKLVADQGDIDKQLRLIKQRMMQIGVVDFLDYNLPIGKIQYQLQLIKRLAGQAELSDFLGVNLKPGQLLQNAAKLRDAVDRTLGDVSIGVGLDPSAIAAEAEAAKAAAIAALGGPIPVPVGEQVVPRATVPVTAPVTAGAGAGGLEAQAAAARTDAAALLGLAAASRNAADAAKFAYAANIANNVAMSHAAALTAPVTEAAGRLAGRWGVLTNKFQLFGGVLKGTSLAFIGQVALWHLMIDSIIETAAVLIPATVGIIAFGAAAGPTVQHIYVQMKNIWTASNALNTAIYPLTKSMMSLGDAVKPEVYQLFGQALAVASAKAGEFSKIAAGVGRVLDQLGARASAALVSGGFSAFLRNAPQDVAKIGDIIGNIFGTIGNLLKSMPGYAQTLLSVLDGITKGIEAVSASPLTQWLASVGLAFHGILIYGGLAVTGIILLGNALAGLAVKAGIASDSFVFFNAAALTTGIRQMIGGVGLLAGQLVTLGAGEDIAAAGALALEGAMAALSALLPVLAVGAAAGLGVLIYWLTRARSATADYDAGVKAALQNAPVSQLGLNITREMTVTLGNLQLAQAKLNITQQYAVQTNMHTGDQIRVTTGAYQQQAAIVAGYRGELGTLAGYQANYNALVKVAGGNLGLLNAAGITSNDIIGASASKMAQLKIQVQAEADQFKAMALGVGRNAAAMNALNYAGDTTNNMLGSMDVDMQKVVQGQDALNAVILGGEQAFIGFDQAVQQWGTDLGKGKGFLQQLTGETAKSLTTQSDFYNTVLPAAQKLIGALEMQLVPTSQLTAAVATEAKTMLALNAGNRTGEAVIISMINNALGPGTVSFRNLNTWVKNNSVSQQGFQSIIAQSTVAAATLGGTITTLTRQMFNLDLMQSAHVTPDLKTFSSAVVSTGLSSDATQAARQRLISDYEKIGLSAQAATRLVNGLTQGLLAVPPGRTTTLHLQGVGTISLRAGGAYIQGESGHIVAYAGGTSGAAPGWGWVGEAGPELVKFSGGETVVPSHMIGYAGGTPGADLKWMQDTAASMEGRFAVGAGQAFQRGFERAWAKILSGVGTGALIGVGGGFPPGPASGAVYALERYAASLFPRFGWAGAQILPLGALWMRECLTLDAVILTRRGWLRHDQVRVGDETIGYNPATGRSEWTCVTRVVRYQDAEVWQIGGPRWHAKVTPEHRWWSDYRLNNGRGYLSERQGFVKTAEFSDGDRLRLAAVADTDGIPGLSPHDAAVLGWLMGDGHIRRARGQRMIVPSCRDHDGKRTGVNRGVRTWTNEDRGWDGRIFQSKPAQIIQLRALLASVPHSERLVKRVPRAEHHLEERVFLLARSYVTDLVKRSGVMECGPDAFVLALSPDQRAAWLAAMIDAKGSAKGGYIMVTQKNGPLCDAIQLAVYLEGHRPNRRRDNAGTSKIGLGNPHVTTARFQPHEVLERQPVWCVTTDLGTWTAQQDGQMFLTGNSGWNRFALNPTSGAYGIAQALPASKYPFAGQAAGGSSAAAQIQWGEGYIAGRYGTPAGAWAHEVAFNWYGKGTQGARMTMPPPAARHYRAGTAGTPKVVVEFRPTGDHTFDQLMTSWLCKATVIKGGGSVQVAFGQRTGGTS